MRVALEVVDNFEVLQGLEAEWSSLAGGIPGCTPFQLPEWLLAWWPHFGSGQIRTFAFRHAGQLIGFIPCFLHEWNERRQLTLIGSGISDYLEPLIVPTYATEVVSELSDHMAASHDWDVCEWQDLAGDTVLLKLDGHFAMHVTDDVQCLRLSLSGTFDEYWARRSADLRRNVKRYAQRAESNGSLQFEYTDEAPPDVINALIRMHTVRWNQLGEPGMVQANRSGAFLREIAAKFSAAGLLRIFVLRFDNQIAAGVFAFRHAGRIFGYMSAFNPEHEEFGFGRTILYHVIRHAFENGFVAFDFLRGNEKYKLSWGPEVVPKRRITLAYNAS